MRSGSAWNGHTYKTDIPIKGLSLVINVKVLSSTFLTETLNDKYPLKLICSNSNHKLL
ncbi:hypothetical protein EZJ58_3269 [Sodalis ligni]|uniref:Uncharacterized protein n=1 Tax=Sodalis ligni TaxID=2697027 RepID=A0A4R1NE01_9GAMM|nr:hypothetical protein EZJ58_3269 [Sodalis ligni]